MTDELRVELPQILEEHVRIRAATRKLGETARANGASQVEALAHELQQHARTEEEITYPAAVLVGTLLRDRPGHE